MTEVKTKKVHKSYPWTHLLYFSSTNIDWVSLMCGHSMKVTKLWRLGVFVCFLCYFIVQTKHIHNVSHFRCTGGMKYIHNVVQCHGDFLLTFYWTTVTLQCCVISAVQQNDLVIYMYMFFFIFFSIVVYSRILNGVPCAPLLFLNSMCNSLHLLTPDS